MTTRVQITKIGDEYVLPLTAELLDKLGVQNGGEVEVTTSDDTVVMRRTATQERAELIKKYTAEIFAEHREVLQALAEGAK